MSLIVCSYSKLEALWVDGDVDIDVELLFNCYGRGEDGGINQSIIGNLVDYRSECRAIDRAFSRLNF